MSATTCRRNLAGDVCAIMRIHAFLEHEITDVKLINSLDNLQPLLAKENSKKNNKYDKDLFLVWLQIKGI